MLDREVSAQRANLTYGEGHWDMGKTGEIGKIGKIGVLSPWWRRVLLAGFRSRYFRRKCRTSYGTFEAYVSPSNYLSALNPWRSLIDPVHERFIREWIKPDAIVWDIGANMRMFALPASLKTNAGRIYA
jgi:hypothetical protein